MTKSTIAAILQNETLGNLLRKFNRLETWNTWLKECLPEESVLFEHCQIVGLDKTSVIVIADNPHWVTRFRFFIPDLLIKLRHYDDFKDIRAICCKVKPPHFRATKPKRHPLIISNNTAEILKEAAKKIKNEKLKAILNKMAERNIEKL
jgi:hypothetical protein